MKKVLKLTLLGILVLNHWTNAQTLETKFQAIIDSVYSANPTSVGIMVSIVSPEQNISWSGASGYSNRTDKTELDADQPALIASITKMYVSATILRLVENGKLSIDQPVGNLLTPRTKNLFEQHGYDPGLIMIKHLLSHTSGIRDFINQKYIDLVNKNKSHRWTRDEQLELTIKAGPPLGKPESVYSYSDANYLLLSEIIESITEQPFYTAMRALLDYESLNIHNTWFPTLEEKPGETKPLVHQYWGEVNWDSRDLDASVDLYGAGGIASTSHDLASFAYKLFNNEIIKDTTVLHQIFTKIPTRDFKPSDYHLGLSYYNFSGLTAYGHGGFWGTRVLYFPELKTSIAVYVLERDKQGLINGIVKKITGLLKEK